MAQIEQCESVELSGKGKNEGNFSTVADETNTSCLLNDSKYIVVKTKHENCNPIRTDCIQRKGDAVLLLWIIVDDANKFFMAQINNDYA